jgi:hypothetical protein
MRVASCGASFMTWQLAQAAGSIVTYEQPFA